MEKDPIFAFYSGRAVKIISGILYPLTYAFNTEKIIFNTMEVALSAIIPAVCSLEAERTLVENFFEAVVVGLKKKDQSGLAILLAKIKQQSLALC